MRNESYDVVVIGAGPSGVMAAAKAAEAGARTILLEKETNPGRKVCAEGILAEALPDAEVKPSNEFVANEISGAVLYPPDEKKKLNIGGAGYILDKPSFLTVLSRRAQGEGAFIGYGAVVEDILRDNGHMVVRGREDNEPFTLTSSIVIGCDGVGSIVARRFFPRKNYVAVAALQYSMNNCNIEDETKLEIYVGHEKAPSGYVWVFPKGKREANVGIGLKGSNAKQLLDRFIARHPLMFEGSQVEASHAAPVPVGGQVEQYVTDNVMLCGDAAGQVVPLTGAGIHTGLVSGKLAGAVAGEAIQKGDHSARILNKYRDRFDEVFGTRISNSLKAMESYERLSDEDLNIIADYLEGQDLVEMANGFNPMRAVGLLVHHPVLAIKVAYQLLSS